MGLIQENGQVHLSLIQVWLQFGELTNSGGKKHINVCPSVVMYNERTPLFYLHPGSVAWQHISLLNNNKGSRFLPAAVLFYTENDVVLSAFIAPNIFKYPAELTFSVRYHTRYSTYTAVNTWRVCETACVQMKLRDSDKYGCLARPQENAVWTSEVRQWLYSVSGGHTHTVKCALISLGGSGWLGSWHCGKEWSTKQPLQLLIIPTTINKLTMEREAWGHGAALSESEQKAVPEVCRVLFSLEL